uniref:RNA helicase n=1 Tax=Glossina brevipalpis TaxID=37001 RepID=A0A1A9VZT0_9MUSC
MNVNTMKVDTADLFTVQDSATARDAFTAPDIEHWRTGKKRKNNFIAVTSISEQNTSVGIFDDDTASTSHCGIINYIGKAGTLAKIKLTPDTTKFPDEKHFINQIPMNPQLTRSNDQRKHKFANICGTASHQVCSDSSYSVKLIRGKAFLNKPNESSESTANIKSSKVTKKIIDLFLDDPVRTNEKSKETEHNTIEYDFLMKPMKSSPLIIKKSLRTHPFELIGDGIMPLTTTSGITMTAAIGSKGDGKRRELTLSGIKFDKTEITPQKAESEKKHIGNHNLISSNKRALLENQVTDVKLNINIHNEKEFERIKYNESKYELLAHSGIPSTLLKKVNDAQFLPWIHDAMLRMRINKVNRIQRYTWKHLLRNNSLFIVNPRKSGKTWAYLPALCNDIYYDTHELKPTYGPIAIVLVASTKHVQRVHALCRNLLCSLKDKAPKVASFDSDNFTDTKTKLLDNCGILITTPSSLLRLLNDNENVLFDAERLNRIVIDDIDLMLSSASDDFEMALKALFRVCKKTKRNTLAAQLVVTSNIWNNLFEKLLRLSNEPLMLIGDCLEAAVYGRAELSIILPSKLEKNEAMYRFIGKHNETFHKGDRTVILCNNEDDIEEVMQYLEKHSYNGLKYCSYCTPKERHVINEWKHKISNQILICTDDGLLELQITNAQNLIHYSMPPSWTQFTTRFSVLQGSYGNRLINDFEKLFDYAGNSEKNEFDIVCYAPKITITIHHKAVPENHHKAIIAIIAFL